MMGKKALEAGTILVQETNLEGTLTAEEFIKRRESMLQSMFPGSELMPGKPFFVDFLFLTHHMYSVLCKFCVISRAF